MIDKPHNNFFIQVFSNRDLMIELLTQFLPDVSEKIDLEKMELDNTSYINDELKELYSDIVYSTESTRGEKVKVALLFEHKSYPVEYVTLQMADYIFSIFRNNVQNKEPLTLVIPILFYHGKTPWKYKTLNSYFKNIDDSFKRYIPNFDYHIIDLTQYTDEQILELRMSFLINTLIAFKHKHESNYIKEQPDKVFYRLEFYPNSDYSQLFVRALIIYMMSVTNIKGKTMKEIIETLPTERKDRLKTTLENVIEMGEERGIQKGIEIGIKQGIEKGIEKGVFIGKKRGEQLAKIYLAIDAINQGMNNEFIISFLKVSDNLVSLIRSNLKKQFESQALKTALATQIILTYKDLGIDDIAQFCKMETEQVQKIKDDLYDTDEA